MAKLDKMWTDGRLKAGRYAYTYSSSLHCTARETNKTLLSNCSPIKIYKSHQPMWRMEITPPCNWSLSSLTITDCYRQPLATECPISPGPRLRALVSHWETGCSLSLWPGVEMLACHLKVALTSECAPWESFFLANHQQEKEGWAFVFCQWGWWLRSIWVLGALLEGHV